MPEDPVSCSGCGRTADQPPVTWTMRSDGGRRTWLCEACTRAYVRDIEAKLDERWW